MASLGPLALPEVTADGRWQMADAGVGGEDFNDLRSEFMRAHHGMLVDPRNDVEALDRAGCGPRVTDLARLAIAVSTDG